MSDPYATPETAQRTSSTVMLAFGGVTLVYAVLASGCGALAVPVTLTGGDPQATALDKGLLIVCALLYVAAFVPALAALFGSSKARLLHLAWAIPLLVVEVVASASYAISHDGGWLASLGSVGVFCTWPIICVVILPLLRDP